MAMRVLLVDDEMELVSTLAERLEIRGIDAVWATSGEEAMTLEDRTFDVAVLDVKMPKISGIELKKKLQARYPDIKFIFMTGHGSEADFHAGSAEAGADFYLIKPVDIDLLIRKMHQIINT